MSDKRSIQSLFTSRCEAKTASVRETWRKALQQGDYTEASRLIKKEGVSANTSAKITGENPLKTLSLADEHSSVFIGQQTLASMLIAQGIEMHAPDKFGMYPADWAMLSGNREMARMIVKETIRQFHEHGRKDYMPEVDPFFATCVNWRQRNRRFDNLILNHSFIGRSLVTDQATAADRHSNGYQNHLSQKQTLYWERPYLRKQADMPYYTPDLIRAVREKWRTTETPVEYGMNMGRGSWALDVEAAHDNAYKAQITRVRELRREKREKELSPN